MVKVEKVEIWDIEDEVDGEEDIVVVAAAEEVAGVMVKDQRHLTLISYHCPSATPKSLELSMRPGEMAS